MQKYDAPPLSFYSDTHDCIIAIGELGQHLIPTVSLMAVPMLVAFFLVAGAFVWRRRLESTPREGAEEAAADGGREIAGFQCSLRSACDESLLSEAHIVFWTLTLSIVLPVVAALLFMMLQGAGGVHAKEIVGLAIFYGLHLYFVAFLIFSLGHFVPALARYLISRRRADCRLR